MQKITKDSVIAFFNGNKLKRGNMRVNLHDDRLDYDKVMLLHGNAIAVAKDGFLTISDCGWETTTTKSRLNGILEFLKLGFIFQKDFVWYYSAGNGCVKPFGGSMEIKL